MNSPKEIMRHLNVDKKQATMIHIFQQIFEELYQIDSELQRIEKNCTCARNMKTAKEARSRLTKIIKLNEEVMNG